MNYKINKVFLASLSLLVNSHLALTQSASLGTRVNSSDGILLSIASDQSKPIDSNDYVLSVTLSNHSSKTLLYTFMSNEDPVRVEIQDATGAVPKETDFGCRRHHSGNCAIVTGNTGAPRIGYISVESGHSITFPYHLGKEYFLISGNTYTIQVVAEGFVLADVPASVFKKPKPFQIISLSNYNNFPHILLAPIKSNVLPLP